MALPSGFSGDWLLSTEDVTSSLILLGFALKNKLWHAPGAFQTSFRRANRVQDGSLAVLVRSAYPYVRGLASTGVNYRAQVLFLMRWHVAKNNPQNMAWHCNGASYSEYAEALLWVCTTAA